MSGAPLVAVLPALASLCREPCLRQGADCDSLDAPDLREAGAWLGSLLAGVLDGFLEAALKTGADRGRDRAGDGVEDPSERGERGEEGRDDGRQLCSRASQGHMLSGEGTAKASVAPACAGQRSVQPKPGAFATGSTGAAAHSLSAAGIGASASGFGALMHCAREELLMPVVRQVYKDATPYLCVAAACVALMLALSIATLVAVLSRRR